MHPLTEYRHLNTLSQVSLARQLGCSPGFIMRTEQGLYETISPKFSGLIPGLQAKHTTWIRETRLAHSHHIRLGVALFLRSSAHGWPAFIRSFNTGSVIGFCKLLVVQHSRVVRCHSGLPDFVGRALMEGGVSDNDIESVRRALS